LHIFTYGSLMFPEIWQRVVRGSYRAQSATAAGFIRYALSDDTYPGMIAQVGATVDGLLYLDVNAQDVAALDAFEGAEYRRDNVTVVLASGESVPAGTYIFTATHRLSTVAWEPEAFQMTRFIGSYCRDKLGE
jgi:gamma-glutamylcyclotransferase (GGCT)/AIG2-like uncharacterized protein YtfP